jgi:hypothetical protein
VADNIDITPGTGKTVATDEVTIDGASAHVQRVKVTWGAAGSASDASASNPLPVTLATVTGISDSRKVVTTAGARVQLAALASKEVIITAETDNTGIIAVGGSTVVAALATRTGVPLAAGDSVTFAIDNTSDIYLDSTVSGDGVTYAVLT